MLRDYKSLAESRPSPMRFFTPRRLLGYGMLFSAVYLAYYLVVSANHTSAYRDTNLRTDFMVTPVSANVEPMNLHEKLPLPKQTQPSAAASQPVAAVYEPKSTTDAQLALIGPTQPMPETNPGIMESVAAVFAKEEPETVTQVPAKTVVLTEQATLWEETRAAAKQQDLSEGKIKTDPATIDHWQTITVKKGDNLAKIFSRAKLSPSQLHEVIQLGKPTDRLKKLYPGETLKFRISSDNTLQEILHRQDALSTLQVMRVGSSYEVRRIQRSYEVHRAQAFGVIEQSLFLAGLKADLSDTMIMELAGIFGWDIDFALDIRQGDRFGIIYEELFIDGKKVKDGEILAANFTNRGNTYRAIRFTDGEGRSNYYSPDGHSMRKAFLRTPVEFSRISSRFNLRRKHPILNRIRAHRGVDYAAPTGTPVRATGDGTVIHRGRKGGYGKTIIIKHGSNFSTLYAHLSKYSGKVRYGGRVKQGQVIGYIGQTGLASGPHLHYEFRANGVHRNPLTVKFPHAAPIAEKYRNDFLVASSSLLAQLEELESKQIALQP